jgi:hypothetical protein
VTEGQTGKGPLESVVRERSRPKAPKAPGAVASPQMPGQVPDRSTVPGHFSTRVSRPIGPVRRPLTQYGTAQEIVHVYPAPNEEPAIAEFEQATASGEELRKAYPWQKTPRRPTPDFDLGYGVTAEAPSLPGGAYTPELPSGE